MVRGLVFQAAFFMKMSDVQIYFVSTTLALININASILSTLDIVNNRIYMNTWKVSIEYSGEVLDLNLKAQSYTEVYLKVGLKYPKCSIISIDPFREIKKTRKKLSK